MPDLSSSSLPFKPTPDEGYEKDLMGFLQEAIEQGDAYLKSQKGYDRAKESMDAVMGIDSELRTGWMSNTQANHVGKIALDLASMMTDTKPFWEYRTPPQSPYEQIGQNLGKLAGHWYTDSQIDMRQSDVIKYALTGGTSYPHITWDPRKLKQSVSAEDFRDVLPICPEGPESIQDGLGVIIRRERTLYYVKSHYGVDAGALREGAANSATSQRYSQLMEKLGSPFWDVLTRGKPKRKLPKLPVTDVFVAYLHDDRINEKSYAVEVGDFDDEGEALNNWSYIVQPGEPLYPSGRMIEWCSTWPVPLYDGPNIYWHGLFPCPKFTIDPWPWTFIGKGPLWDILPLQKSLDKVLRVIDDQVEKIASPDLVAEKGSMSEGAMNKINTRRAGLKIRYNPAAGKPPEIVQGKELSPSLLQWKGDLESEMKVLSGSADASGMMRLQQMPSDDTISKIMEAMSPAIRARSRVLEAYTREFGKIVASNFLQFSTQSEMLAILGPSAVTPEWFDYDPKCILPDYIHRKDYDANGHVTAEAQTRGPMPRRDRAKELMEMLSLTIAPGSMLNASETEAKLLYLQLSRAGLVDHWTLLDRLGIPNVGNPPDGAKTISERLQAEQGLGIGMNNSSAGRKASGQTMPRVVTKES